VASFALNARRLIETPTTARYLKAIETGQINRHIGGTLRNVALWVEQSLIIRLMIRVPLRQRNIREMRLYHNLLRRPDGTWMLTYRGTELKMSHRNGRENCVSYTFPPELQELLEDWLARWRPLVVNAAGAPFVFVTRNGNPIDMKLLRQWLMTTTWAFNGVAVNPHMLRHIWATEYIKSTHDIIGAAYMLGDTVQTVLKHYAHLLDADAEVRAMQWLRTRLAQDPESTLPSNPDTPPQGQDK
jgi:site-specific recombinase XerC